MCGFGLIHDLHLTTAFHSLLSASELAMKLPGLSTYPGLRHGKEEHSDVSVGYTKCSGGNLYRVHFVARVL